MILLIVHVLWNLANCTYTVVVLQEEPIEGGSDGTVPQTGEKHFHCPPGRGMYFPVMNLKPDQRFTPPGTTPGAAVMKNRK